MPKHSSPFGKHKAELIATKSNKIFTFSKEEPAESPERSTEVNSWAPNQIRSRTESPQLHRPNSRMSSFYNGYCSPLPCSQDRAETQDARRSRDSGMAGSDSLLRSGSPNSPRGNTDRRSESPGVLRTNSLRSHSPSSPRYNNSARSGSPNSTKYNITSRSDSPSSPRRNSQEDCTEENCLNLFHQHNLNKSPRSNYSDWGKSSTRSLSRTPTPTKSMTSRDSAMTSHDSAMTSRDSAVTSHDSVTTSRDSGVVSRTPSPSKDASLDRLSQAIRDMDKFYHVGLEGGEVETLTGMGESVNVTELDKMNMLLGK